MPDHEERISRLENTAARQERMIDELHDSNIKLATILEKQEERMERLEALAEMQKSLNREVVAAMRRMDNKLGQMLEIIAK